MEEKLIKWALGIVIFYTIFILLWKRFWDTTDPPPPKPPKDKRHE